MEFCFWGFSRNSYQMKELRTEKGLRKADPWRKWAQYHQECVHYLLWAPVMFFSGQASSGSPCEHTYGSMRIQSTKQETHLGLGRQLGQ